MKKNKAAKRAAVIKRKLKLCRPAKKEFILRPGDLVALDKNGRIVPARILSNTFVVIGEVNMDGKVEMSRGPFLPLIDSFPPIDMDVVFSFDETFTNWKRQEEERYHDDFKDALEEL